MTNAALAGSILLIILTLIAICMIFGVWLFQRRKKKQRDSRDAQLRKIAQIPAPYVVCVREDELKERDSERWSHSLALPTDQSTISLSSSEDCAIWSPNGGINDVKLARSDSAHL